MEVRPGYKQTELGVIPEEWEALPARDIGAFKGGSGFPLTAQGKTSGAYPFFKVSDMNNEGNETFMTTANHYVSEETRKRLGATAFPNDSIVFAKVGAAVFLERKKILGQPSCIDNNMAAFVLDKTRADVRYVHSLLLSKKLGALVATTALPALNGKQLGEMALAVPPLPEQRAIAAALSDVDALLGGLDRLIAKKRDLKQAAMQQLLTGQTRLPGFSGAWEVNTVAELEKQKLVKLSRGQVISKKDIDSTPGDCPIYSSSIHNNGLFGRYGDFMFDEELITWSVDGGGNFFHRPRHKFSVTNVCGFMRVETSRIDYRFFAAELQLLHSRKSFDYQSKAHPSVIRKEYEVHLPALAEQTAIAAVLSDMDAELAALEARRDKTRDLKQAMMQELLTGRTRLVKPEAAHA